MKVVLQISVQVICFSFDYLVEKKTCNGHDWLFMFDYNYKCLITITIKYELLLSHAICWWWLAQWKVANLFLFGKVF